MTSPGLLTSSPTDFSAGRKGRENGVLPSKCNNLSRNHAVGQASRLSLILNDRLEALFSTGVGDPQIVRDNFQMETGATPVLRCDRNYPSGFNCMVPVILAFRIQPLALSLIGGGEAEDVADFGANLPAAFQADTAAFFKKRLCVHKIHP